MLDFPNARSESYPLIRDTADEGQELRGYMSLAGPHNCLMKTKPGWKWVPWTSAQALGRSCTDPCHQWLQATGCEVWMRLLAGGLGLEWRTGACEIGPKVGVFAQLPGCSHSVSLNEVS